MGHDPDLVAELRRASLWSVEPAHDADPWAPHPPGTIWIVDPHAGTFRAVDHPAGRELRLAGPLLAVRFDVPDGYAAGMAATSRRLAEEGFAPSFGAWVLRRVGAGLQASVPVAPVSGRQLAGPHTPPPTGGRPVGRPVRSARDRPDPRGRIRAPCPRRYQ